MAINFKKLKENTPKTEFEPIPTGRYDFEIEAAEIKMSKSNNEMIEATLRLIDNKDHENRKMWHKISLQPKAQFFLLKFLTAAGSPLVDNDSEVTESQITKDLVGRKINGYVTVDGKGRNNFEGEWKLYSGTSSAPEAPTTENKPPAAGGKKNLFK